MQTLEFTKKFMKNFKNLIKRNKLIFSIFLNIFRRNAGFHSDKMTTKAVKEISGFFPITSFIETGTYRGDSSFVIARNFPKLPIYTCEIAEEFFEIAKERLKHHPMVRVFHQSSEKFLNNLSLKEAGNLPLFFLDAHWYDYWPLADELNIIDSKFNKAIIIIDDFQVPGRKDFKYQKSKRKYEENPANNKLCNFDFVRTKFKNKKEVSVLYPDYSKKESRTKGLTGYGIIFKNLKNLLLEFTKDPWVKNNFKLISDLGNIQRLKNSTSS